MTSCAFIQKRRQCRSWYAISAPHVHHATDVVIVKDRQHPFTSGSFWSHLASVEQNQTHHCLVDPALCVQRYFMPQPKMGLHAKECGATNRINPASGHFDGLAISDYHLAKAFSVVWDALIIFRSLGGVDIAQLSETCLWRNLFSPLGVKFQTLKNGVFLEKRFNFQFRHFSNECTSPKACNTLSPYSKRLMSERIRKQKTISTIQNKLSYLYVNHFAFTIQKIMIRKILRLY